MPTTPDTRRTRWSVSIDWDNDGNFTGPYDNVTPYLLRGTCQGGSQDFNYAISAIGTASVTLENKTRIFSPDNTASPLFGKLLPRLPVRIQAIDQLTGATYPLWFGYTKKIGPTSGLYRSTTVDIDCEDRLAVLDGHGLDMPLQINQTTDYLIRIIINQAFLAATASQTVSFTATPANNDTITINGVVITLKTTLSGAANELLIGADPIATNQNFYAMINATNPTTGYAATISAAVRAVWAAITGGELITISFTSGGSFGIGNSGGTTFQDAQGFTPAVGGVLGQFTFKLNANSGAPSGTMTWEIRNDNGNTPGSTVLATSTLTPTPSATNTVVVAGGPTLVANTKYWLVLKSTGAQSAGNFWNWDASVVGGYPGGSAQNSTNGGASYTDFPGDDLTSSFTLVAATTLTSLLRGAVGNAIALAESSAGITLGGSTLAGGADAPAGAISLDTGRITIPYAGDNWQSETTTALSAIQDIITTEWGYFFQDRSGNFVFHNRDWIFKQITTAAALSSDNATEVTGDMDLSDVYNHVRVSSVPRSTLASGVILTANNPILVPGQSGSERWSGNVVLPGGGVNTFKLEALDPTTKQKVGILSLTLPPRPNTDWKANEQTDSSGVDYSVTGGPISFSVAVQGTGVEVTAKNTALGPLYLTQFKLTGAGLAMYDPVVSAAEDATSETAYGKRVLTLDLPMQLSTNVAIALAGYLLSKYKVPKMHVKSVRYKGNNYVNGVPIHSIELGQTITLTDAQMGISGQRYLVIGNEYERDLGDALTVTLFLERLDDVTYGILDDAVYGKLDSTARCAI